MSIHVGSSSSVIEGTVSKVNEFFLHPKYDALTLDYDVATIHVRKIFVSMNILPIHLIPIDYKIPDQYEATLSGWLRLVRVLSLL